MDIIGLAVQADESGMRIVTVTAALARGEEMDQDDLQRLIDTLEEANGGEVSRDTEAAPEADPEKPKKRTRKKAETAEEPEPEATEEPKKRTRKKAEAEDKEPEKEEPKKRTRKKKEEAKEPEFDGPSQDDVNLAAANLAEAFGSEEAGSIIVDGGFSPETGMVSDIPPEKRQEFLDEVDFQMAD